MIYFDSDISVKEVIRSPKSKKDSQCNDQKKKGKNPANNDLQNNAKKTKD